MRMRLGTHPEHLPGTACTRTVPPHCTLARGSRLAGNRLIIRWLVVMKLPQSPSKGSTKDLFAILSLAHSGVFCAGMTFRL